MILTLGGATVLLYLSSSCIFGWRLQRPVVGRQWLWRALALTLICHAGWLFLTIYSLNGLNLAFFHTLSLSGFLMGLSLLALAAWLPFELLGLLLLPLNALIILLALIFPSNQVNILAWPLQIHIILSITAYSLLALAALQAILLAAQDRRLRQRQLGGWIRYLPPLTAMESLLFQLITVGFIILSLALLSGLLFVRDLFAQHLAHKTVFTLLAWIVFAVLLWGRRQFGWRGRYAARWTLSGFGLLALAYFGSRLVLELWLQRS